MNIKSTILLVGQDKWLLNSLANSNIKAVVTLPRINRFSRLLRKIWFKLGLPIPNIWFGEWKHEIIKYDTVILFANKLTVPVLYWLQKKYPKKRIILWFWNPVSNCINPQKLYIGDSTEIWTFDKNDSEEFGMRYNTSFYIKDISNIDTNCKRYHTDIFFIGLDKGRYDRLYDLKNKFTELGIRVNLHIVKERNKRSRGRDYSAPMSYNDVINNTITSKAILEIMQEGQTGVTLRCYESLFYRRKLITDNSEIAQEPFYSSKNIFIIGIDDFDNLPDFINSEWDSSVDKWIEYYTPDNWLKRFG